jgi:ABC-2 type transport system permease protein/sodium transport system permease protein
MADPDRSRHPNRPPPRKHRANNRLARLCQKELRETLRDRRTITTLLLMPLLVYPLLSMALNRFLVGAMASSGEALPYIVGVGSDEEGLLLASWVEDPMSQPPDPVLEASGGQLAKFHIVNTLASPESVSPAFVPSEPLDALKQERIDLVCDIERGTPPVVRLTSSNTNATSQAARRILIERLQWLRMRTAESAAAKNSDYVPPADVTLASVGQDKKPSMLGTIVPLVLVLMTITGAVYPAIDLTAGERERGTMESLMASPVPRSYVLFSKYVAVVVVALLTAVANLLAMFTTLWAGRLLPVLTGGEAGFPWLAVLQVLGLLVLFSGFFAAVLLSLTSFARSFKEAQAYLIPIMLLSLTPGMLSLMPGVTLSGPLAITPLINIVLLAREVLQGTAQAAPAVITVLSTIGYAAAAIAVASKLFGNDAVHRTSTHSFGSLLQRPDGSRPVPSPQTAAMTLAFLVPVYYLVSNGLMRIVPEMSIEPVLVLNAVALAVTFGLIPLLAIVLTRARLTTSYRLAAPNPLLLVGTLLIGLGAWGVAHESFVIADQLGIGGLDAERIEQTKRSVEAMQAAPAWLLVICLAITPAVIEEFCFRGFLFSAFGKLLTPTRLIVVTAVIFGLFHVVTGNMLLVERFVPTTLLGLILGWIAYRSGSVWPGVLTHLTHNALLVLAAKYSEQLQFLGEGFDDQKHLPVTWFVSLVVVAAVGGLIVWGVTRERDGDETVAVGAFDT